MRIGIFGGTFDPIHIGHLVLAEQCREQCQLDEVWFVPAAVPPHKQDSTISPAKTRCEMIEFAISGNPRFKLCAVELDRPGPSYTVTTLEQFRAERPQDEFFLLMGGDSIRDLPTWRQPERILELATVVAVNRGLTPPQTPDDSLEDGPHDWTLPIVQQLATISVARVEFVQIPGLEISATDIRQRVAAGKSIRYLVPRAVEAYIDQHGVYRSRG